MREAEKVVSMMHTEGETDSQASLLARAVIAPKAGLVKHCRSQ